MRLFGAVRAQVGVDTRWDSPTNDSYGEHVFDLLSHLNLGADVKLRDDLRLVLEGRLRYRAVAQRDFQRAKGDLEPTVGEAYVDWYGKKVDLRVGNQLVAFGANAAFAPADSLNPRDFRDPFLSGEPEDTKLPALAAVAKGTVGRVDWTLAYFPFFTPNRYYVFGQDEALVQPSLGKGLPPNIDPSIEDPIQPHVLETERPKAFPWVGDVGARATTEAHVSDHAVKIGASWVWMNEKFPQVYVDDELSRLLATNAAGKEQDPATVLSVQNRLLAGEKLYVGKYARTQFFSVEGSTLARTVQLDFDLAYSPGQTFVDANLRPVTKESVTWVVGASQADPDSKFLYALTYVGIAIPDVQADKLLFLIEPSTAQGAARTAFLHLLVGTASYTLLDDKLELSLRAGFEPIQRSFAIAPRVTWKGYEPVILWVGAEFYEGPTFSPFGYFGRNDQVLGGLRYDFF